MPNALAGSSSPYLLQHADNPVDWLPWGEAALSRARSQDKPILLSIGYSACHWCHVMAHESFENPAIAALMNQHFVNIKVDREARPDLDAIYMEAVQAMTGRGGWPLTAFLTPRGEPFYGGTYFPPAPRHGMAGFPQILEGIAAAWRDRREEVLESAARLSDAMGEAFALAPDAAMPGSATLARARAALLAAVDRSAGGFGQAPKFPQAAALGFLLDGLARSDDPAAAEALSSALDGMARGGIWDHLAGGFHRYSVDAEWSVPHFEKMLYDNAQLARLYAEAARQAGFWSGSGSELPAEAGSQRVDPGDLGLGALPAVAWGSKRHRDIALATSGYALRELQAPEGSFQAAQDADTADGEGAYFAWRPEELAAFLDPADRALASAWFGFSPGGNFEHGASVLSSRREPGSMLADPALAGRDGLGTRLAGLYAALRVRRGLREAPATDRKRILAWNGLMIDALARQSAGLGGQEGEALYRAATRSADFLLARARLPDGELARFWIDGRAEEYGFLDDHAALAGACLSIYEARFELRWFEAAQALAEGMLQRFADPEAGGFFRSGPHHEVLIARQKPLDDGALPSGNALAADLLLRLHGLTGQARYIEQVEATLRLARPIMERAPLAAGAMLRVLATWQSGLQELAVVGGLASGASDLLHELRRRHRPGLVVAWAESPEDPAAARIPLLADRRPPAGGAAAWLCRGQICELPVTDPLALRARLEA